MIMDKFERDAGGHGGDIQSAAEEFGLSLEEISDFSSNINPLGPPPGMQEEIRDHLDVLCRYPSPQAREFLHELCRFLNLGQERVFAGNGANDLIHLLMLWKRPRRILIPYPTFSEYARAASLVGAQVIYFPLSLKGSLDIDEARKYFNDIDFLVFCSPNNPTGFLYHSHNNGLHDLVQEASRCGITVLIDESFFAFSEAFSFDSLSVKNQPGVWVVVSLTKLWALPGLRLGYLVGPAEEVKQLKTFADPWRVNALAQRAGIYCLKAENYLYKSREIITEEREFLYRELERIPGLKVYPTSANFLLVRIDEQGFNSSGIYYKLATKGLLIRDASNYPGLDGRYFRIAVKTRLENQRLISELSKIFGR